MWRLLFSCWLVISVWTAQAQLRDTTWVRDWKPSFVRIGVDVSRPVAMVFSDYRKSFEAMAEFDTDQYFIIAEGGFVNTNRIQQDFTYDMSGAFIRIGFEKNILKFDQSKNVFGIGLRYARAGFSDQINFTDATFFYGSRDVTVQNPQLNASWFELTSSLKIRMWENLYMGFTVRIKTNKKLDDSNLALVPYDIPGFGRHRKNALDEKSANASINYFIYYTIPFRDKPVPVRVYR